jgi:hypothetical protein
MLIANPIYDSVFKHLLENERVAKFFIGTLISKTIRSVKLRSPEHTYIDPRDSELKLFRMDFVAEIENENGKTSKIIIEMQKADKFSADIMRFRRYLGHEYMSDSLPITSIYVLGFTLPGIETACLRINRNYYDLIEEKELKTSASFVERLTHDCYIVQTPSIKDRLKTPLDRLLSVFEQRNFTDKAESDKSYNHPISDDGVKEITDILHYLSADPKFREELDKERYYREYVEDNFGELYAEIEIKSRKIAEKDAEIQSKEAELQSRDAELQSKDAELEMLKKKLERYEKKS